LVRRERIVCVSKWGGGGGLLKDIELLVSWFGVNHCRMDVLGR
jgi:hypothetical protein